MELYAKMGYAGLKLPTVYDATDHVLSLPVHPLVTEEELTYIADHLKAALKSR